MPVGRNARFRAQFGIQFSIHARAFFGRQPGQVQRFKGLGIGLPRIEPAGQQNFIDQLVEFVDAARDFFLGSL